MRRAMSTRNGSESNPDIESTQSAGLIGQAVSFMHIAAGHASDGQSAGAVELFDVINPVTGSAFARAPEASREQLDLAVAAARRGVFARRL